MLIQKPVRSLLAAALIGIAPAAAMAQLSPAEVDRLGKDLTLIGAEIAGNKDGSIPAYTGGISAPPPNFTPGKGLVDPFKDEKPILTITAANMAQHQQFLTAGQMEMMKRYPTYKMNVYKTHRTAAIPPIIAQAVKDEAGKIKLVNNGDSVQGAKRSTTPFPIPKSGVEVIWNHTFRFRGDNFRRTIAEFPVSSNGQFTPVVREEEVIFSHSLPEPGDSLLYFRTLFKAPSSIVGEAILARDYIDQKARPREAWTYNAGARRVIRAPDLSYASPRQGVDGLSTIDDYDSYNGSPDRYTWKLIGKQEKYIPYNNFKLADRSLKYKDIIQPNQINPDLVRYEKHRVWVVEGTLKQGADHIYGKRVYYIDEDSWAIAHGDIYDKRGELWRVLESYALQQYDGPAPGVAGSAQYDLQARRYVASGFSNEGPYIQFNLKTLKVSDFQPDALRRMGN